MDNKYNDGGQRRKILDLLLENKAYLILMAVFVVIIIVFSILLALRGDEGQLSDDPQGSSGVSVIHMFPEEASGAEDGSGSVKLIGIIYNPWGKSYALLNVSGVSVTVSEGDKIAPDKSDRYGTLSSITAESVTISENGVERQLELLKVVDIVD